MEHTVFGAPSGLLSAAESSVLGELHWSATAVTMFWILE